MCPLLPRTPRAGLIAVHEVVAVVMEEQHRCSAVARLRQLVVQVAHRRAVGGAVTGVTGEKDVRR